MSRVKEQQLSERLLETAASWVVVIDERRLTEEERERFKRWVLESEAHRLAFEQAASIWGRLDVLQGLSDIFPIESRFDSSARRWRKAIGYSAAGIAASALIAALYFVDMAAWVSDEAPASDQVYLTQVGETATIDLDDGSRIVANTDSRLSVEYSATERRVRMDRGEAFFEVEHDPNRAFSVIVGNATVRAVGTAFSVFRDGAKVQVLVSEGVVEVVQALSEPGGDTGEKLLLQVGQVAELGLSDSGLPAAKVESIETQEVARRLSWRQGMLAFDGESLEQVIDVFGRYTTVDIQIASDDIRDIRVGGYFDTGDLAGMLTALESNFGIDVTYVGPDQVLLTSSR
jgi:transmembrane sensor